MDSYVLGYGELAEASLDLAGGKAVNIGALDNIPGIQVPEGFCVTTMGYKEAIQKNECFHLMVERLSELTVEDRREIAAISEKIRKLVVDSGVPAGMEKAVVRYLAAQGEEHSYAVRSSATAEDLPHASFAGQHDTYLNIRGKDEILKHISRCWASLFTERAVMYRMRNRVDHRQLAVSVIVQRMVFPKASGVLFTADPITCNRKLMSIDATFGLGEELVAGMVSPDCYKVRDEQIIERRIAVKKLAVQGRREGGTETRPVPVEKQKLQCLTDEQILQIGRIGRKLEEYFGYPQDIEWAVAEDGIYILQSRPITTLFPIPDAKDNNLHVYVSVGHQQMMTDPMRPLGLSFYLLTTPAPMRTAGGRLFVDISQQLASPSNRALIIENLGKSDPLIKDALLTFLKREEGRTLLEGKKAQASVNSSFINEGGPAVTMELMKRSEASIKALKQRIAAKSGTALFNFILEDIQQLKKDLFSSESMAVIMSALNAAAWINEHIELWLGEKNAADALSQSVDHNVTSEMGLALLDVADAFRPYPEAVDFLQNKTYASFLDDLEQVHGGEVIRKVMEGFLQKYGMRCPGEIDIARTRWSENPAALAPIILNNVKQFKSGEGIRKFKQGRLVALQKEEDLLKRLRLLPDGEDKARDTKRMIDVMRKLIGYREYPKYGMVQRYYVYKQALLKEAAQLLQKGIIQELKDVFELTFEEFHDAVRTGTVNQQAISQRKTDYQQYKKLSVPRVITSDGEIFSGDYKREGIPAGALPGLAVSSGLIEGRARVILNMEDANLEEGDILVTTFTDPSWTPLFVSIKGLVTEVGGLMTHGAVIAREYGIPAVVAVKDAVSKIADGQRILVHGTEGYIKILE